MATIVAREMRGITLITALSLFRHSKVISLPMMVKTHSEVTSTSHAKWKMLSYCCAVLMIYVRFTIICASILQDDDQGESVALSPLCSKVNGIVAIACLNT